MNKAGALKSPLTWLAGLIVLYLGYPLAAFAVRLVTSPQRGFHAPGLFPALWVSVCRGDHLVGAGHPLFGRAPCLSTRSIKRASGFCHRGHRDDSSCSAAPHTSGIVLVYLVGPYTFLGQLCGSDFADSMIGVVIAMTFVFRALLDRGSSAAFAGVQAQGLLDVAKTLGHSDLSNFLQVAVPAPGRASAQGMLLTWLRAFGEYGAVVILAYDPASTAPSIRTTSSADRGLPTTLAPAAFALRWRWWWW